MMSTQILTECARGAARHKSLGVKTSSTLVDRCTFLTTKRLHRSGNTKLSRCAEDRVVLMMRCSSNVLHTLISSNVLADRLGVSRATIVRAVERGRLRPALVTPGGHRRFSPQDVEGFGAALPADGPALVGSAEAARILGVSQQTLNRAVRTGRLKPATVTPGGHRRFSVPDLEASLRATSDEGAAT